MELKLLLWGLSFLILTNIASAGTVSITGTCQSALQPGNTLNFTIINTGNDTAYNLLLTPFIFGAKAENSSYPIGSLPPNQGITTLIPLTNFSTAGTYTDYFTLAYQQGTSVFTALFPCIVNLGKPTTSGMYLTTNTTFNKGAAIINVSLFNDVRSNFTVNVSALFPPSFSFISQKSYLVEIGPYQTKKVQFQMNYLPGSGSYTGAISESYVALNQSHSSFVSVVVSTQSATTTSPINYALWGGIGLALIIAILTARSFVKNRKKTEKGQAEPT